jgi:heme exporter protein A
MNSQFQEGIQAEIQVSRLVKSFGRRVVLDEVSFSLAKGGFLSIFGPNGAGKTTLIKILSTLVAPTSGKVTVAGTSIHDNPEFIRRQIGLISHHHLLYRDLNAYENLEFYGRIYGVKNLENRIDDLLQRVELSHRRFDLVKTYSRGMLQRLAIARALLHQPRILFLDEPHSGLDPHAVDILDGLISNVRHQHTFIMITHDLSKGLSLCTAAMILDNGHIVYQGQKEDIDMGSFEKLYRQTVKGEIV